MSESTLLDPKADPAPTGVAVPQGSSSLSALVAVKGSGLDRLGLLLHRFLDKGIRGRLVVLGSAPGTGKSSLVKELVDAVPRQLETERGRPPYKRLLLVPLHGPTLFGTGEEQEGKAHEPAKEGPPADSAKADPAATAPAKTVTPKSDPAKEAPAPVGSPLAMLQELIKALHFAAVRAIVDRVGETDRELGEILRVDLLRGDASLERLQAIWEQAGGLDGLLVRQPGQGWREITALWNLNRAFMVISGVAKRRRAAERRASTKNSLDTSLSADWARVAAPALALSAGVAAGTLVFPGRPELTALLALAGAVGGGFSWSANARRRQRTERSEEFTETLDEQALFRWMPEILQQMKDVGLYPVVVVDEVRHEEWGDTSKSFLAQLDVCRGIVNLGAFICLLTDRTTYRTLGSQGARVRRRLETSITDRIFVSFLPKDLVRSASSGDGGAEQARRRAFFARARPLALVLEPPSGRASDELANDYQAAVDAALALEPRVEQSPEERAFALDMLYEPARAHAAGARVFDNSRRGITEWAWDRGWIRPGQPAPPWLHDLRKQWLDRMGGWLERPDGGFARWREKRADTPPSEPTVPPASSEWFITEVEADAFVRDVSETVSQEGTSIDALLPPGGDAAPLADRLARNASLLQEILTAGYMLAWLSEGVGMTPTRVQAGIEAWRPLAPTGVDGLRELQSLCGLGEDALDPWPLEAGAWSGGARALLRILQGLESARGERRRAAIERGRAAWRKRLRLLADGAAPTSDLRRLATWAHLSPMFARIPEPRLVERRAFDWSILALESAPDLTWAAEVAMEALGWGGPARPRRVLVLLPPDPAVDGANPADPGWRLPGPDEPALLVSSRPKIWLDVDHGFTDVFWVVVAEELEARLATIADARRSLGDARFTLLGALDDEDRDFATRAVQAPCLRPCPTLAETLRAVDSARATTGSPTPRA